MTTITLTLKKISFGLALFFTGACLSQNTYVFTNASATGSLGPTQAQVNAAYAATNLNGQVISNNGIQSWTVPVTGPYKIKAYGAQGGGNGGFGAKMEGCFNLVAGQVLNIVVGQQGGCGTGGNINSNGGGGGGGSFIVLGTNSLLIAAGGGGGGLNGAMGGDGLTTLSGGSTYYGGCGTNGNGGYSGITNGDAAGGGGFFTNGQNSFNLAQSPCEGGKAFLNGAIGGNSGTNGIYFGGAGGFGGGGSGWHNSINRCGGGGGYSGGQGGTLNTSPSGPAGGGGSFNNGNDQQNLAGANQGNGSVIISFMYGVTIAQTSTIMCNGSSTGVLTASVNGGAAPYTYTWLPTGGSLPVASNLAAGVYTLITKDNNNLSTSATYTVTQPAPIVVNAYANSTKVCTGNSVILTGGGADIYSWTGNVINGVAFIPTTTGSYTVTGTNTLTGCSSTATINISVKPAPAISFSASANTMCTNGNPIILSGLPGGGNYAGTHVNGNIFTPVANGTFVASYHYTDANTGCSNTATAALVVTACTGMLSMEKRSTEINLYPNPSTGIIHLETNQEETKVITVLDMTGRLILAQTTTDRTITLDISELAKGIYYVTTKTEGTMQSVKVIKL